MSEDDESLFSMMIGTLFMAFIEGFKLSECAFNWELMEMDFKYKERPIGDFLQHMKKKFMEVSGFNE